MTHSDTSAGVAVKSRSLLRLGAFLRMLVFVLALVSILGIFLIVTGIIKINLTEARIFAMLTWTGIVVALLLSVVIFDLIKLFRQSRLGLAGARLHLRIVGLFTLIAAVPAILIAVVASITLERGLNPWFSGSLRELVTNSETIAVGYQQQLCQNVGREMRLLADDLDNAKRTRLFDDNRSISKISSPPAPSCLAFLSLLS